MPSIIYWAIAYALVVLQPFLCYLCYLWSLFLLVFLALTCSSPMSHVVPQSPKLRTGASLNPTMRSPGVLNPTAMSCGLFLMTGRGSSKNWTMHEPMLAQWTLPPASPFQYGEIPPRMCHWNCLPAMESRQGARTAMLSASSHNWIGLPDGEQTKWLPWEGRLRRPLGPPPTPIPHQPVFYISCPAAPPQKLALSALEYQHIRESRRASLSCLCKLLALFFLTGWVLWMFNHEQLCCLCF